MFVRDDAKKPPLQPTYNGPFKVVDYKAQHVVIARNNGRTDSFYRSLETCLFNGVIGHSH